MFTDKLNVLELLSLLKAHHVEHAVLCPGSRDIPIVQGLAQCPWMHCISVTDERSAGFYALGIIQSLKKPCAVVVTSGSALANLHPAVCEAYYRQLPLLVISADRPLAFIGQRDGQTLPQAGVFSTLVKYAGVLPEIKDQGDRLFCNRICNEALIALNERPFAPVHLNVPIGDPFFSFPVPDLPAARTIFRAELAALPDLIRDKRRILVIFGQNDLDGRLSEAEKDALASRFTVYAEHLANASHPAFLYAGDAIFSCIKEGDPDRTPDLVICLGGHLLSKHLKRFLRNCPCSQISITDDGAVYDTFGKLSHVIRAPFKEAVRALISLDAARRILHKELFELATAPEDIALPYCQLSVTRAVLKALTFPCALHLANSSSVRYAAYFRTGANVEIFSNRGVNGIEGSLSAAVGSALADPARLHILLIGDLSFFYDMNALWRPKLPANLRIVLFNNAGGEIFAALPGLELDPESSRFVTAPHQTSALPWASACGLKCLRVEDLQSFERALPSFLNTAPQAQFMEVITSQDEDIAALRAFRAALRLKAPPAPLEHGT